MDRIFPYPDWLNATLASDAAEGLGVMPGLIQALKPNGRVVGPAFTVLVCQDANSALVRAIAVPPPAGCVIDVAVDDGVVVWPKDDTEKWLEKAREELDKDDARLARLLAQAKNKEAYDEG